MDSGSLRAMGGYPRKRLFSDEDKTPTNTSPNTSGLKDNDTPKTSRPHSASSSFNRSLNSNRSFGTSMEAQDVISRAFNEIKNVTFGKEWPAVSYTESLSSPETQFEQIVQKANEYLAEVHHGIVRFKNTNNEELDVAEAEGQIELTIFEISKIAYELQVYLDEVSERRLNDSVVSPRVLNAIKANEDSLNGLNNMIKSVKREMQVALKERERKDLLGEWTTGKPKRTQRDAEELMSDSTERLLNSKRILLETIQSSSGTLGALATSSQSIQKNDEELSNQTDSISTTHSLLQKYGRRATTDKHLIWLGFLFFGFCAVLVAYRRLF